MIEIYDTQERLEYWRDFWTEINEDADELSSDKIYPLYPTHKYIEPKMSILEAGVGMGRVMKHYGKLGYDIIGMDYEEECIKRLGSQHPDFKLYVGDVNQLTEPDCTYDAILAFGTLSNLQNPVKPLSEFYRVLKPGGIVVASITNDNLARRLQVLLQHLKGGKRFFSMMAYTRKEWGKLLKESGFEVLELAPIVTRLPLYTYFPFLRARNSGPLNWKSARDGDKGLELNSLGEFIFNTAFRFIPFSISHGVVGVVRKT